MGYRSMVVGAGRWVEVCRAVQQSQPGSGLKQMQRSAGAFISSPGAGVAAASHVATNGKNSCIPPKPHALPRFSAVSQTGQVCFILSRVAPVPATGNIQDFDFLSEADCDGD